MPPYAPLFEWLHGKLVAVKLNFANYAFLFTDALYVSSYLYSMKVAAVSTLLCLLHRLPDGVRHRALQPDVAQRAVDVDRAAVLDLVPAARLCVDRAAEEQRRDQQRADVGRASFTSR